MDQFKTMHEKCMESIASSSFLKKKGGAASPEFLDETKQLHGALQELFKTQHARGDLAKYVSYPSFSYEVSKDSERKSDAPEAVVVAINLRKFADDLPNADEIAEDSRAEAAWTQCEQEFKMGKFFIEGKKIIKKAKYGHTITDYVDDTVEVCLR